MPQKIACPQCQKETFEGKYCIHCRAELHPEPSQGRKKLKCPACGKETFEARYCLYCRADMQQAFSAATKEMIESRIDGPGLADMQQAVTAATEKSEWKEQAGIILKARAIHGEQQALSIVDISMVEQLPNGAMPNVKRLVVQPGSLMFVVSQFHNMVALQAGQHDLSQRSLAKASPGSEMRPAFLCTVSQRPIVTTFFLPDLDALFLESGTGTDPLRGKWDVEGAVRQLSLRTADNLLGAASAQLVLQCTNPSRLLDMFIQRKLHALSLEERNRLGLLTSAEYDAIPEEDRKRLGIVAPATKKQDEGFMAKLLSHVGKSLFGEEKEPPRYPQSISISMLEFYRQVRMEFAAAIIESIRNDSVEQLYNTVEIRERIADDIQRVMSQSFEMYGVQIQRVSAFRFICPQYEEVLKRRGDTFLDGAQLADRKKEMEVGRQQRRMAAEEARDVSTVEAELQTQLSSDEALLERHKLKEARETEKDRDLLRAEQLQRQLAMDAEAHRAQLEKENLQHQLEMEKERRRLQLQGEKMEMALGWQQRVLQIQNQQQDLLLERRIKMLEQYARLPKDSILTLALAENPQLAAAYAASVQAQSLEERAQMQEKFRQDLSAAYAGNNAQFSKLLQEAVRQWGQYQSAKELGKAQPQQVINLGPRPALPNQASDPPAQ